MSASDNIFVEKASGLRHDRPVLAKALATLEKGDTLASYRLDRIARSLAHVDIALISARCLAASSGNDMTGPRFATTTMAGGGHYDWLPFEVVERKRLSQSASLVSS